ncbi:Polyketide cyclase/dehydrase [Artemisia annua]|uniref:Polyketide cyclase/dehydrase n=1 Tax=Artemisia annua TaxID=35608 RepID=A0A2U1NSH4_ARTAN|nr:Polyketide cyclase/dehydrase [Artemisia annua]
MEKHDTSNGNQSSPSLEDFPTTKSSHHLNPPPGLTNEEFGLLKSQVAEFHMYNVTSNQCSSLLAQHINAPVEVVWSVIRQFDKPQIYKHFIKSCSVKEGTQLTQGCQQTLASTERLDLLDDEKHVMGFTIIGGEHRLRNYRAVTTVHEIVPGKSIVLESYVVDVPEGNTEEDTRFFADTVVKLNLQKLASVTQDIARGVDASS